MNDFLRDPATGGDIMIKNGDLVIGDATGQHQQDLITADKGWYHHVPVRGVGVQNYLNDNTASPGLAKAIRQELMADGQTVTKVSIENGQISVQGSYE